VRLTLVIGGTRSGKSVRAERLAAGSGLPVRYVGTGDRRDPSMRRRIDEHVARRPAAWKTVDVDRSLAAACADAAGECVLVDGLGPWIATQLHVAGAFDDATRIPSAAADVRAGVLQVGRALGSAGPPNDDPQQARGRVLPAGAASRAWVDLLGEATQHLAALADRVELVVAGRVLCLGAPPPDPDQGAPAGPDRSPPADPDRSPPTGANQSPPADPDRSPPTGASQRPPAEPDRSPPAELSYASLRRHGDRDVRPGDADHAVNVVAGGLPPWLRAALDGALTGDAGRYPREEEAVAALAARHARRAAEIVPTNGAAEALWLLAPALRPTLAACVHPGFTEPEAALRAHGVPTVRVLRDPDRDFALAPDDVPRDADLVVLGNPASPCGTLVAAATILALRRRGRTIVVDEAFMELVPGEPGTLVGERLDDVIVIRSLTKALGVPGLRVGYAVACAALADRLRAVRPPWSANVLALAALRAAADHPDELAAIAARASAERDDLHARLSAVPGVRVWPGAANYVLVAVADGPAAVAALRGVGIAVRPAASFPGLDDRHIRITARDPASNARVVDALTLALAVAVPA
jgi:histidinol-phosphate/aromatic aminotransferase/cobyric acid decarboxylase-like protein/adenosyl cobinamide kinase/adenosyl cobinamide phosphate guanylyltransferase